MEKRARFIAFLALTFAALFSGAVAWATPILKLEFKSLPDQFISGTQLDLPLYLVENRNASESSRFSGYPATPPFTVPGPFPLASVESDLSSTQSLLLSFTPLPGFNSPSNNIFIAPDNHSMRIYIRSPQGVPVTVDNSGIIGRTEILLGSVRVQVGLPIPQDDGIGDPEPDVVFWTDLSASQQGSHNASLFLGPSGSNNQGELFLGGIYPSTYKITAAPTPQPTPTFAPIPSDPGSFSIDPVKKYKQYSGVVYPNFTCNGPERAVCNGKAQLYKVTKVGRKNVKTLYGKCTLPESSAPFGTYCIMKLTKTAKALLGSPSKKFSGTLSVSSTGISALSTFKVTVKK